MMLQDKALALLKSGKNVFLTGSAGAGKTYVLNQYIEYLKDHDVHVAVTASTGIAATHMNGMTIHAWSGIGVKDTIQPKDLAFMREKKYLKDKLEEAQVLIIDEISMLHRQQLEMVNLVLKSFKGNNLPFGGIQVVFSGDFFQLPPIGKPGEEPRDKFAFMSEAWVEAGLTVCYISEQHRQSDNQLNQILNSIREGSLSKTLLELLSERNTYKPQEDALLTRLYTHNLDVDRLNNDYLQRLKTKKKTFKAVLKGNDTLKEIIKKSVLTDEVLHLKIGARVMFIKNNYEKGYMNGSIGEVIDFDEFEHHPYVKLVSGKTVVAEPEDWSIQDDGGKVLASFKQVPLRLAWAITIHKSQGMTLDAASIDLSKTFERGQGYVALSRLRDIEHLYLEGFNQMALEVDALALKADKRFRELSTWADSQWSIPDLEKRYNAFIEICGGTVWKKGQTKSFKRKKPGQAKIPSYVFTGELVSQGLSLEEMAETRGFTVQTILSHLRQVKENDPTISLEAYKPKKEVLAQVSKAVDAVGKQSEGDKKGISTIHAQLEGQLTYNEIRLAMLFI